MHARLRFVALLSVALPATALAQGGPLTFYGTPVAPLGGATLSIAPDGKLVVRNLGSSGLDGFELQTGRAQGVKVKFPWLPNKPAGSEAVARILSDATLVEPSMTWTFQGPGGGVDIFVDFSSTGAAGHLIEICNDGVPLAQTVMSIDDVVSCGSTPIAFDFDVLGVPGVGISPLPIQLTTLPMLMLTMAEPTTFVGAAGPIGIGNQLRAYPSNPLTTINHMEKLSILVDVPAAQAPDTLVCDDAAQLIEGRLHRGMMFGLVSKDLDGNIRFNFSVPGGLTGGIEMEAKASETQNTITQNLKFGSAGDTDAYYVTGQRFDGLLGEIMRVSGACNGLAWTLTPDFSGLGSSTVSVQLFDAAGVPVTPPSPVVGSIVVGSNASPTQTGHSRRSGSLIMYDYSDPVPVTTSEGTFPASRIEMSVSTATPTVVQNGRIFDAAADLVINVTGEPNTVLTDDDDGFYVASGFAGGFATTVDACPCVLVVDDGQTPGGEFVFEPVEQEDQFGVEWAHPPDPITPETDWDFVSRLAGETVALARMGLRVVPAPTGVALYAAARQTPKTDFGSVMKSGATTTAEFVHSDERTPFAILPQAPAAIGYQVLHYPDRTWSMWIDLGQIMEIVIPGGPAGSSRAANQVVSADFIHLTFLDTPVAAPVAESHLVMRGYGKSHRLFYGAKSTVVSVGSTPASAKPSMRAPYPNPFNPSTTVSFDLPAAGDVSVRVYTVRGEHVATLHSGWMAGGTNSVRWNGIDHRGQPAASGVYLVELRTPAGTRHAKMTLLK